MGLTKTYSSNDLDWNIGALFAHDDYIVKLLLMSKDLGIEHNIKYVFGSVPCLFSGGRIPPRDATWYNVELIIDRYNKLGIGCRLTFSNIYIDDYKDELSNKLLQKLYDNVDKYNVKNGVIVTLDKLAKYIKKKYSKLELISSQVKPSVEVGLRNDNVEYYNKLFSLYDVVVVNPNKVHDIEFLRDIKHKDRVEFIVNHRCFPDCKFAGEHYKAQMRLCNKFLKSEEDSKEKEKLNKINDWCLGTRQKYPLLGTSMMDSDINLLLSLGYKHFKIEGRDNDMVCFMRDLGEYIYQQPYYSRILHSIFGEAV